MNRFDVFHEQQPDGDFVAVCRSAPGWFCFGGTLEETRDRAEWSLRDWLLGGVDVKHYEIPPINHVLRAA